MVYGKIFVGDVISNTNFQNNNLYKGTMGKLQLLLVLFVFLLFQSVAEASRCGFKPYPKMGCEIGRCMDDGEWEQICDQYGSESVSY